MTEKPNRTAEMADILHQASMLFVVAAGNGNPKTGKGVDTDAEQIFNEYGAAETEKKDNGEQPMIITIMNESFSDLSVLGPLACTEDDLSFFYSLKDDPHIIESMEKRAHFCYDEIIPAMQALRSPADQLEMIVDKEYWPIPSYGDMIFEV